MPNQAHTQPQRTPWLRPKRLALCGEAPGLVVMHHSRPLARRHESAQTPFVLSPPSRLRDPALLWIHQHPHQAIFGGFQRHANHRRALGDNHALDSTSFQWADKKVTANPQTRTGGDGAVA